MKAKVKYHMLTSPKKNFVRRVSKLALREGAGHKHQMIRKEEPM